MEENPPRVSRSKATREASRGDGPTRSKRRSSRFAVDDGGGDLVECSGKYCRSCTAGLVADCVALCCCPCAVVHCFALAFVKAPWVVGRRCLGLGKNKKKNNKGQISKRKCKRGQEDDVVLERNREGNLRVGWPEKGVLEETVCGFGGVAGEMDSVTVNAGFEAEKVWLELYQIGHLDFGRVSFSDD